MDTPTPRCAAHKEETLLRCGRCEQPICPRCTVMGPAGARCRSCSSHSSLMIYQVTPRQVVLGFAAAAVVAAIGGGLLSWALDIGVFGFFWLGLMLGGAVGEAAVRAAGRKRGRWMEVAAGLAAVAGASAGMWIGTVLHADSDPSALLDHIPALLVGAGITAFAAVVRVRFK